MPPVSLTQKAFRSCLLAGVNEPTFGVTDVLAPERVLHRWDDAREINLRTC